MLFRTIEKWMEHTISTSFVRCERRDAGGFDILPSRRLLLVLRKLANDRLELNGCCFCCDSPVASGVTSLQDIQYFHYIYAKN